MNRSSVKYSLMWLQPYLEKRTQEFQIIQCPSASYSYHYPCLWLFSCKEWGWRTSGDTQFWQVTHLAVDAKQLGHVGRVWEDVHRSPGQASLGNLFQARLGTLGCQIFAPLRRSMGAKSQRMSTCQSLSRLQMPSMSENHAFYLRLLAGFRKSWWLIAVIIMS